MKKLLFILAIPLIISCSNNSTSETAKEDKYPELTTKARSIFAVLPVDAETAENPLTIEKVALGKMLYFDNRLSKDDKQSCNTCHDLAKFGVDNKALSEGNDGTLGVRNSPTTLNSALHFVQFWDGREPDVEAQAGGPILNHIEMAMPSEKALIDKLAAIEEYKIAFSKAYPEDNPAITFDNLKKAIGAFERKLITPSKFDDYIGGNQAALTDGEKEGMRTFMDVGCTTCHSGRLLGGMMYQKFALYGNYWDYTKSSKIDEGRFEVTKQESDKYMFKVPSLRNIDKTGPYFHDGSVASLDEAITIMGQTELNKELSGMQVMQIKTFLSTLTGELPTTLLQ
jgi:cytochrome c peroxidase